MTLRRAFSRRRKGGRMPSLGQDHDRGHREYVARIGPEGETWLRTKPFSAPPIYELARCLHTFAHIVDRLQLPLRAQVLDVGCGPGWMSEYLARCGYWVTGIDISPDMVRIAEERVAAIEEPIGASLEPHAEFHAMHVREMPWRSRFDAAILYDTMHHFDDELETLSIIRSTLVPGGLLYLHEGARPEPGSEGEKTLIEEMEKWETLESPFDPDYLAEVVEEAGFVQVQRLLEVDQLIDLSAADAALERLSHLAEQPDTNTLIAQSSGEGVRDDFAGRIDVQGGPRVTADEVVVTLVVTNTGRSFWPASPFPCPSGTITIGAYLVENGGRLELARVPLPHSLIPGSDLSLEIALPRTELGDSREVAFDLVREGIAWFSEPTSPLLLHTLP